MHPSLPIDDFIQWIASEWASACVGKCILWYWARRKIRRQILQPNDPVGSYGRSVALLQAAMRSKIWVNEWGIEVSGEAVWWVAFKIISYY